MGVSVGVADVLEAIAGTKFALSVLWATVSGGNITHVWNIHACIKLERLIIALPYQQHVKHDIEQKFERGSTMR